MLYAEYDSEIVWASEFAKELANINTCRDGLEKYPRCPECGGRVSHHSESIDGRAAHFQHCSSDYGGNGGGGGNCGGATVGESAEHTAMKSIAASALEFALSDVGVSQTNIEVSLPAPYSDADHRTGDVVIDFEDTDPQLGDGLIAEVQYKNKTKDRTAVTIDYLNGDHDYSVLWLGTDDFYTSADLPKDWNCKVVHEDTVRERVREQIWPPANGQAVWEGGKHMPGARIASGAVNGLSAQTHRSEHTPAYEYIRETRPDDEPDLPDPTFAGSVIDQVAQHVKEQYGWANITGAKYVHEDCLKALKTVGVEDVAVVPAGEPRGSTLVQQALSENAEATSPPDAALRGKAVDAIAQQIKESYDWSEITEGETADRYIEDVAESSEGAVVPAHLRGTAVDMIAQQIKKSYGWSEITEGKTADRYIEDVAESAGSVVPVRIPPHLMTNLKLQLRRAGKWAEPDKPSNPFDDIQCWNCGTFWWAGSEKRYHYCPDCGEPVDLEWNVKTGRISEKPYHIKHGSDTGGEA